MHSLQARLGRGPKLEVDAAVCRKVLGSLTRNPLHTLVRGGAGMDGVEQPEALRQGACTWSPGVRGSAGLMLDSQGSQGTGWQLCKASWHFPGA